MSVGLYSFTGEFSVDYVGLTAAGEYVFAARDRYDESYDMVRAVRDNRYKYIRNYYPGLPYLLWIPYHNRHPVVQEMWRLHAEQRLEGRMRLLMGNRPAEELYDTSSDPFEMKNLAEDPACRDTLIRMRLALDDWRQTYDDQGEMSEEEMVRRMRPEGSQPRTAAPLFVPICPSSPGIEDAPQGGSYRGPLLLQLFCATQGASIVYTTDAGSNIRWRLYTGPLRLSAGMTTVRARASRIGYAHSEEISAVFISEGQAWLGLRRWNDDDDRRPVTWPAVQFHALIPGESFLLIEQREERNF